MQNTGIGAGKGDPESPRGKEAAERQGLWANNLQDRRTAAPLPYGGSARQGRGRALGPPWQEEQERQVPGGTGRPGDSHDGNLPFPLSKPQTSCLPTWSAQPASCARAGPRGICIQMGFFQYSWFVTNGVKLLPSVTCSCPQARPGPARPGQGCGWSPPAPRPRLLGLPPCRGITEPMWERDRGWGFGSQGQTSVWPTFAMASPSPSSIYESIGLACVYARGHTPAVLRILSITIG